MHPPRPDEANFTGRTALFAPQELPGPVTPAAEGVSSATPLKVMAVPPDVSF
jgi:hypothetical protein